METRREFLKAMVAGTVVSGLESEAKAGETEVDSFSQNEYFRSRFDKIDLNKEFEEMTPEVKKLIFMIVEFQTRCEKILQNNPDSDETSLMMIRTDLNREKSKLWETFVSLQLTKEDYSEEEFAKIFTYDLPRVLSNFGVHTPFSNISSIDIDTDVFRLIENRMNFFPVKRVEKRPGVWGGDELDVVYVGKELVVDGVRVTSSIGDVAGQAIYQNVYLHEREYDSEYTIDPHREFAMRIAQQTLAEKIQQVRAQDPKDRLVGAYQSAYLETQLRIVDEHMASQGTVEDMVIAHEGAHVNDATDTTFKDNLVPKRTASARRYFHEIGNLYSHEEINGHLGDFKGAKHLEMPMSSLIKSVMKKKGGDKSSSIQHDVAAEWILSKFVQEISADHEKYGISLVQDSDISVDIQIILQLPAVIKKRGIFLELVDKVKDVHDKSLDENFYEDIKEHYGFEEIAQIKSHGEVGSLFTGKNIAIISSIAAGTAAAAIGLKKFGERKNKIKEEEN